MDPSSLRFTKSHEWVSVDGDIATIGISAFAVAELTDVVHIELPAAGEKVAAGSEFGEIESVKAVSELNAPVSGEITEVNDELEGDLGQLSEDPYGKGWMIKVRMENPAEVDALLDHDAYKASTGQ